MNTRELLIGSFEAAVSAADPAKILPAFLPAPPKGRTLVVGAGKAAASMALAIEQHWPSGAPLDGIVVTRYRHGLLTNRITVIEAGHPVPDQAGEQAAAEILKRVKSMTKDDLVLAVISGGGSSLMSLPAEGISPGDMKTLTAALLKSGATIQEMNTIRKHVSAIQGGRLAAASRAPVVALIVSDVTGDDPTHIASGPCAPDPTTYGDAIAVLERYDIDAPRPIVDRLRRGVRGDIAETPKPGDRIFRRVENHVIATAQSSLAAASKYFIDHRVSAAILGDTVTGEAREVGKVYAALARQVKIQGNPWKSPIALISGGECTVTVKGRGRGGRCSEFLLSLGVVLDGLPGVSALACDTDGIDGSEDNAGAILTPDTLKRAARKGLNASSMLELNDAYGFFAGIGDLVVTGPTRTNVNDYRAILIE